MCVGQRLRAVFQVMKSAFFRESVEELQGETRMNKSELIEALAEAMNIPCLVCKGFEADDVIGTIWRSTGAKQIPLLIKNSRSTGGGSILDHCILKIVDVKSKRVLYQHEKYITPKFEIGFLAITGQYSVTTDGKVQANFKTEKQAQNYIDFMLCKRMSK